MEQTSTSPNTALKEIFFGSLSGMAGKLIEYPFDTVKVRLQSQRTDMVQYSSTMDCLRQTLQVDGFQGLYRGLPAPMIGAMFENAILFVSFSKASEFVRSLRGMSAELELDIKGVMCAGALSGIVTSFVLTPIELVKCQLQVQTAIAFTANPKHVLSRRVEHVLPKHSPAAHNQKLGAGFMQNSVPVRPTQGMISLVLELYRANGLRGFWRGQFSTLIRESGGSCCWFSIYELSLRRLRSPDATKKDNSQGDMLIAGALAGVGYNTLFFPADTVKSRMQTNASTAGLISTIKEIWSHQGFRGLFKGWGITVLRAAPSNAMIFWVYETLMRRYS